MHYCTYLRRYREIVLDCRRELHFAHKLNEAKTKEILELRAELGNMQAAKHKHESEVFSAAAIADQLRLDLESAFTVIKQFDPSQATEALGRSVRRLSTSVRVAGQGVQRRLSRSVRISSGKAGSSNHVGAMEKNYMEAARQQSLKNILALNKPTSAACVLC
jgi:hypothetical protein